MKNLFTSLAIFCCTTFALTAQSYDTLNFESPANLIFIDSVNGCWQVGKPQKTLFNSAYSPDSVLITDTVNFYPDNTHSTFDIVLPIPGISAYYSLKFKHQYHTPSGKDGGYIQMYDCFSSTWTNIVSGPMSCTMPYGANYMFSAPPTVLHNGEYGFSGTSSGWEDVEIYFPCMAVFHAGGLPEIRLRFVFTSDSITNNMEGWMIDDFVFYDAGGWCSSISENEIIPTYSLQPNPTEIDFIIQSRINRITDVSIIDINGKIVASRSFSDLQFYQTMNIENIPAGIYSVLVNGNEFGGKLIKN